MSPQPPGPSRINTKSQKDRKSTQRERLVAGMIRAANRGGYAGASVTAVIAEARVSRPTFYDYFADRDDCFLAALTDVQAELRDAVRREVRAHKPEHSLKAAVGALVEFASSSPESARFIFFETLGAGPRALVARDQGLNKLAEAIERRIHRLPAAAVSADLPASVVLGGAQRLLAVRLRRRELDIGALRQDLLGWVASYEHPIEDHRWRKLTPGGRPLRSRFVPEARLEPPPALPPGRPRIPEAQIAENHRSRILFAVAKLAERKGFASTTVADVSKLAKIDARTFYVHFSDKQEAFLMVHEIGVQEMMRVTAEAFFSAADWPQRALEAGRAATQYVEANPLVAHIGYVEAFAVGPAAAQRVEDSLVAFSMLLHEGYQHARHRTPARLELDAIMTTLFEALYRQSRGHESPQVAGLLANLTFLALAPFLGHEAANRLIDEHV
jgi:AcrR family transcriptional regulator